MNTNRQWLLAKRPSGLVTRANFDYAENPIPSRQRAKFVRNLFLSFDPTQRGWMEDRPSYLPPVGIGEPMRAGSVGQVTESRHPTSQSAISCRPRAVGKTLWSPHQTKDRWA